MAKMCAVEKVQCGPSIPERKSVHCIANIGGRHFEIARWMWTLCGHVLCRCFTSRKSTFILFHRSTNVNVWNGSRRFGTISTRNGCHSMWVTRGFFYYLPLSTFLSILPDKACHDAIIAKGFLAVDEATVYTTLKKLREMMSFTDRARKLRYCVLLTK